MLSNNYDSAKTNLLKNLISRNFLPKDAINLVEAGADPKALATISGDSLLHILALNNNDNEYDAAINELVSKWKVPVDIKNRHGLTPLELLLKKKPKNFTHTTQLLLKLSAKDDQTQILQALISMSFSHEDAMNLVRNGADPKALATTSGNSLLHILALHNTDNKYDAAINELVSKWKVPVDIKNRDGLTPIDFLLKMKTNNFSQTAQLLSRLSVGDVQTRILQRLISMSFSPENAMNLVRNSADPKVRATTSGNSLLHILALHNTDNKYDASINELVSTWEVPVDIKNRDGLTPLELLLKKKPKNFAHTALVLLTLGAKDDKTQIIQTLIKDLNYDSASDADKKKAFETIKTYEPALQYALLKEITSPFIGPAKNSKKMQKSNSPLENEMRAYLFNLDPSVDPLIPRLSFFAPPTSNKNVEEVYFYADSKRYNDVMSL